MQSKQQESWERSRRLKVANTEHSQTPEAMEFLDFLDRVKNHDDDDNFFDTKGFVLVGMEPGVESEWQEWSDRWNRPILFGRVGKVRTRGGDLYTKGIWEVWHGTKSGTRLASSGDWWRRPFRNRRQQTVQRSTTSSTRNAAWGPVSTTGNTQRSTSQPASQPVRFIRISQPQTMMMGGGFGFGGGGFGGGFGAGGC